MKLNMIHVKRKFQLFDQTGLNQSQIRVLQIFIYAVIGGVVWGNITTGVAMTGYLKELGASDLLYGFVIALPPIANAFQFLISYWMERTRKRTQIFLVSGLIQRLSWLPFALVPVFVPMSQPQLRLWIAVILAVTSACMGPAMSVSFFSLLNDVVPIRIRGRYLAVRSKVSTAVGLVMGLLVGVLLDALPPFTNYVVVFIIAAVFGTFDICCYLSCVKELPELQVDSDKTGLWRMLKMVLSDKRYMRLVLSLTCWFFAVQIGSPYFNVYQLSQAGMAMTKTQVIVTGQVMYNLALVLVISFWGRSMDEFGSKAVLVISAFLTSFMPVFWLHIGPGMLAIVAISNFYSGATYCAVDLSNQNLFMTQAPAKNRSMYFAVYFIFTQLFGLAFGSTAGGYLLDNVLCRVDDMKLIFGGLPFGRYHALFLLTTVLRLTAVLLLLATINDGAPGETKRMIVSMAQAPAKFYHAVNYSIKRRMLRKQYDKERK